ncbi:hypothetical protein [Lentzea aerocolonigenes]|uniref:hypothetical protein n=1 Tax=Lentzea aerocolonigenes TaxID=68170 RepID=UPI0004C4257C|nr:hypothetical protein [Lentzea aerocolonigenes]MCP2244255.1 hypothetical protein [Lentzea aerocolonigenes]
MHHEGCFLCGAILGDRDIPWTDRPLFLDPRFGAVVPGAGALVAGYVLIAPTTHSPSLCAVPLRSGFAEFLSTALDFLQEALGPLTYWEHGGTSADFRSPTSACVDHAHLHVVPGSPPLTLPSPSIVESDDLVALLDAAHADWSARPYLLVGGTDRKCSLSSDIGVPQYFRRQLAQWTGEPHSWDYAAVPGETRMRETVVRLLRRSQGTMT